MTAKKAMSVGILGAGAWGTAIATQLCKKNDLVLAYTIDSSILEQINIFRVHPSLPDVHLPLNFRATLHLSDILNAKYIIVAIPSSELTSVLKKVASSLPSTNTRLIVATKGISEEGELLSETIPQMTSAPFAVLAGPNLAMEVAKNVNTATMIGSENYDIAKEIADFISTDTFQAFPTQHVTELQITGAVKNVAAIVAGILDGMLYGDNTKSWAITLALQDISILANLKNKDGQISPYSIINPGVVGDLALGFYSRHSRNNAFGRALALTTKSQRHGLIDSYPILVEGIRNYYTLDLLSKKHSVSTKIISTLGKILKDPENLEHYIFELFQNKSK
jgi:glycerol-3-phosphate dehydrogenase (NAD(P)+)